MRGTVVDVYIGSSSAAVVILEGQATFCGNDGTCKRLERGCDIVRANRKGLLDVETEPKTAVKGVRNEVSFPFLMGTRKLSKPFQVGGGRCGLSASVRRLDGIRDGGPDKPGRGNEEPTGGMSPDGMVVTCTIGPRICDTVPACWEKVSSRAWLCMCRLQLPSNCIDYRGTRFRGLIIRIPRVARLRWFH